VSLRCKICGDSHLVWIASADRYIPCTSCPVPCRQCASDQGRGAYCAVTDCSCSCHHWLGANEHGTPPPDPPTRDALVVLLQRWRDLESEPTPGEGLVSDGTIFADHAAWCATFEALADETDRAIAAEGRRVQENSQPQKGSQPMKCDDVRTKLPVAVLVDGRWIDGQIGDYKLNHTLGSHDYTGHASVTIRDEIVVTVTAAKIESHLRERKDPS